LTVGGKEDREMRMEQRHDYQCEQQNVILAGENQLEANRHAKGEPAEVSYADPNSSFFDNPLVKILIRIGHHQPHCPLL
jgi:hypothetical protein